MREELLLGFDARIADPATWPPDRVASFALRDDATAPRSVDSMCWGSLFDDKARSRPGWIGAYLGLWEDLAALRSNLASDPPREAYEVIAVTLHAEDTDGLQAFLSPHRGGIIDDPSPSSPTTRDPAWRLLGYDVADWGGISGLSNCGYTPEERARLSPVWGPRLNAMHLFDRLEDAAAFRAVSDTRVTEHVPFHVFGVWLV